MWTRTTPPTSPQQLPSSNHRRRWQHGSQKRGALHRLTAGWMQAQAATGAAAQAGQVRALVAGETPWVTQRWGRLWSFLTGRPLGWKRWADLAPLPSCHLWKGSEPPSMCGGKAARASRPLSSTPAYRRADKGAAEASDDIAKPCAVVRQHSDPVIEMGNAACDVVSCTSQQRDN